MVFPQRVSNFFLAVAFASVIEGVAKAPLGAHARVDGFLHRDFIRRSAAEKAAGAGVQSFGVLADHHEIDVLRLLVG